MALCDTASWLVGVADEEVHLVGDGLEAALKLDHQLLGVGACFQLVL